MIILIMGLPGSGKTTLAAELTKHLNASWINADKIREKYNDWDFSKEGVLRQAKRMREVANKQKNKFIIADFVCPFKKGRSLFDPDYLIWMDTISKGRLPTFDDSFEKPEKCDFKISNFKSKDSVNQIIRDIKNKMKFE